jgi:hypothetical protein
VTLLSLAVVPPIESTPTLRSEADSPSINLPTPASDTAPFTIALISPKRTKLSQWWEAHRDGIVSSVIKVFEVTSKVLEMVPLAEPGAKAFEHAAGVLEEVQVCEIFLGSSLLMVCTHECSSDPGRT